MNRRAGEMARFPRGVLYHGRFAGLDRFKFSSAALSRVVGKLPRLPAGALNARCKPGNLAAVGAVTGGDITLLACGSYWGWLDQGE